jgi:hypothetical protein
MLTQQYRMNTLIAQVSSEELCVDDVSDLNILSVSRRDCRYGSKLAAHSSVEHHTLQQIYSETSMPPLVSRWCSCNAVCHISQVLVDTSGCGFEESQNKVADNFPTLTGRNHDISICTMR